jgi:YQGE family putative transporter
MEAGYELKQRKVGLPPEKRLSREAKTSLFVHGVYQFGASMSGVFLNLYLWRLTHDLTVNGSYNIVFFLVGAISFAVAGKIAKAKDRLYTFRAGIVFIALFYMSVIFFQEKVAEAFIVFAVFNGIANGFYWLGYSTVMYDVSTEQNRIRYLALNSITFTVAGLAGPVVAGFIISLNSGLSGYIIVFSISFAMFVIATIGSFQIRTDRMPHKPYYLKIMALVMKKNRRYAKSAAGYLILGLHQGIMLFLPNILLFTVLPQEDMVGYIWGGFLALSVCTAYFLSRFGRENKVKVYVLIAASGYIAGAIGLTSQISLLTVMLFLGIYYICSPLQMNSMQAYYYRLIGKLPLKGHLRMETLVVRESAMSLGRVISITLLILMADELNSPFLPAVLLAASIVQLCFIWLIEKE